MTVFFQGKSNEEIKVELSTTPRNATSGAGGLDDQVYQRLLKERIIFLGSVVEDSMANAICAQMLLLAAEDPEKDIYLYINSPLKIQKKIFIFTLIHLVVPSQQVWQFMTRCNTSKMMWQQLQWDLRPQWVNSYFALAQLEKDTHFHMLAS